MCGIDLVFAKCIDGQIVERLKKEMAEFEKQKADELKRLEDFKTEEKKKLRWLLID